MCESSVELLLHVEEQIGLGIGVGREVGDGFGVGALAYSSERSLRTPSASLPEWPLLRLRRNHQTMPGRSGTTGTRELGEQDSILDKNN